MLCPDVHRLLNHRLEVVIELTHHIGPLLISFGNLVEFLLHFGREVVVHDSREILQQEVIHHDSYISGHQLALVITGYLSACLLGNLFALEDNGDELAFLTLFVSLVNILTLLDGADGRGVS